MNIKSLWCALAVCALCGCASEDRVVYYHQPLTSAGGEFSKLPPAVQNSVRAEVGSAEITRVDKFTYRGQPVYAFAFRNVQQYPPLYVATDGSVLNPDMTVAVGASPDSIEASTGSGVTTMKMDDLPSNVVQTIRHTAPTAQVESISRLTSNSDVFYDVSFKDPGHHPNLLIRDDGQLLK